ncbi:hypothetical protein Flavo103_15400 [Flavobacterium collinsii]|jgi:hypothetical protein|nr:hypothetical protein Flavo103_15400 [Flavobacterium collinsii]
MVEGFLFVYILKEKFYFMRHYCYYCKIIKRINLIL